MFSTGQLLSKTWLVDQLKNCTIDFSNLDVALVGAWFGTLGILIHSQLHPKSIVMLDIDARYKPFVDNITFDLPSISYTVADMYEYQYSQDLVVNTSCEHIPDISKWIKLIPSDKLVVLQSNNFFAGNGHINCVNTLDEFIGQVNLSSIMFCGQLVTPMYTRFMIIGRT
jgi:hypothetical protein